MNELVVELNDETFDSNIGQSSGTWLVDFWAEWCQPCHALTPVLVELAAEVRDVKVGKLDIQRCPDIASRFDVQSIPTLLIFRDGVPVSRLFGTKTLRQLKVALERVAESISE